MPYVKKMPSGNWKCQYRVDGKYRCVTAPTKKEAEYRALEDQLAVKRKKEIGLTVGEAVRAYIDSRDSVLSPSTVQGYEKIKKNALGPIENVPVRQFDDHAFQRFVNDLSAGTSYKGRPYSPKYISNVCGLLTAALRWADPDLRPEAALPARRKQVVQLLSPEEVVRIASGSEIELPVLLACWLSLSMSEIRGLTVASVSGDRLTVRGAVVDIDGMPLYKQSNKAYDRTRVLVLPPRIRALIEQTDAWKKGEGYLVHMNGVAIYDRWIRLQKRHGVAEPMTFHKLRHLNASVMLALGVPDTYAQQRGGWSGPQTLKKIYQHTLAGRETDYDRSINDYFENLFASPAAGAAEALLDRAEKLFAQAGAGISFLEFSMPDGSVFRLDPVTRRPVRISPEASSVSVDKKVDI